MGFSHLDKVQPIFSDVRRLGMPNESRSIVGNDSPSLTGEMPASPTAASAEPTPDRRPGHKVLRLTLAKSVPRPTLPDFSARRDLLLEREGTNLECGRTSPFNVHTWSPMNDLPEQRVPEIPVREKDKFSLEGLPARRANAGGVGLRAGLKTGLLIGLLLGFLGMASSASHGQTVTSWAHFIVWLFAGPVLGGVIGWAAGLAVGPTQKELAGGLAGAVVGLAGGIVYSPLIGHLIPPLKDQNLETLRRAVIGGLFGLIIGAGLGILHRYIRPRRRRSIGGAYITSVERELQDEVDTRAGSRTGFWE